MNYFQNLSIKNKIVLILFMTTSIASLTGFLLLVSSHVNALKEELIENSILEAKLIGYNCVAAIDFGDYPAAEEILSSLEVNERNIAGYIFAPSGNMLAKYTRIDGLPSPEPQLKIGNQFGQFTGKYLIVESPIFYRDKLYGFIYLTVSTNELTEKITDQFLYWSFIIFIIFAGSFLLARWLQCYISRPIIKLARITREISESKNYSVHIKKDSDDEVGQLYDEFDSMIKQIERREKELIKAIEKAETSERLKSEFLAQMSHEIRTPIHTIMSFASLLRMECEENISEDNSDSFNSIDNAARRLLRTIDLVLNMSEIESRSYEPIYEKFVFTEQVINPLFAEFFVQAKLKNIEFIIDDKNPGAEITADKYTVTQIMANLIDNAIKYTTTGSVILIMEEKQKYFEVSVSDTGIGIKEEYLPFLFSKFSQEEQGYTRKFEGNGLGLALVKNYCELNEATIDVESTKGKGSVFRISFPLDRDLKKAN